MNPYYKLTQEQLHSLPSHLDYIKEQILHTRKILRIKYKDIRDPLLYSVLKYIHSDSLYGDLQDFKLVQIGSPQYYTLMNTDNYMLIGPHLSVTYWKHELDIMYPNKNLSCKRLVKEQYRTKLYQHNVSKCLGIYEVLDFALLKQCEHYHMSFDERIFLLERWLYMSHIDAKKFIHYSKFVYIYNCFYTIQ